MYLPTRLLGNIEVDNGGHRSQLVWSSQYKRWITVSASFFLDQSSNTCGWQEQISPTNIFIIRSKPFLDLLNHVWYHRSSRCIYCHYAHNGYASYRSAMKYWWFVLTSRGVRVVVFRHTRIINASLCMSPLSILKFVYTYVVFSEMLSTYGKILYLT